MPTFSSNSSSTNSSISSSAGNSSSISTSNSYGTTHLRTLCVIIVSLMILLELVLHPQSFFTRLYAVLTETQSGFRSSKISDWALDCTIEDGKKVIIHDPMAVCIDGSRPVYYIRKGYGMGLLKWNIFFEGGGWCYDMKACQRRSRTHVGTSKEYPNCLKAQDMKHYQSGNIHNNPLMYNWNTVHIKYCDGSSYAGDSKIEYEGQSLYFKGRPNRDAFIKNLLEAGMKFATDIVLSGCSAGGLGILLGLDTMAQQIHQVNSTIKIRGMADSGYFLDYTGDQFYTKRDEWTEEAILNGNLDYSGNMRQVFLFTNMTAGTNVDCIKVHENHRKLKGNLMRFPSISLCVFAKQLIPFISTPLFMIQPQYDQWQIWHVYGGPQNYSLINTLGRKIVQQISTILLSKPQHGAFFDACTHHCTSCSNQPEDSWNGYNIRSTSENKSFEGITPAIAFERWYNDKNIDKYMMKKKLGTGLVSLSSLSIKNKHFHIQKAAYPCTTCCICHA